MPEELPRFARGALKKLAVWRGEFPRVSDLKKPDRWGLVELVPPIPLLPLAKPSIVRHVPAIREGFAGGGMKKFTLLAAFAALLFTFQSRAAVLSPLFNPIRTAIATNITALADAAPLEPVEARQLRFLRLAQRNINRAGVPSLFADVQILAGVTATLGRAFPEGEFNEVLQTAIIGYHDALLDFALTLSSNVSLSPPSSGATRASSADDEALEILATFDPTASLGAQTAVLTRAATWLRSAQLFVSRPQSNQRERLTALVDGRSFQASATSLSANYNSTAQFLTLTGREISGAPATTRTITLNIADVTPGTRSHSLGVPASGTYAVFSSASSTNSETFTSTSGNVVVTLDATAGTVSGRFSFEAEGAMALGETVRVTAGNFFLRF